jgi:transposase
VIEGSTRRRRWSREEKTRIVAESLDPVVSVSAVARKHGLNPNQLFTWRRQLRDQVEPWLASGHDDAPVGEAAALAAPAPSEVIDVILGAVTVRVGAGVDVAALRRVLRVVRSLP